VVASLIMDIERIQAIRETLCPDKDAIVPTEKYQVQLRISNSQISSTVLKDLNSFNNQMFRAHKYYAFNASFNLRDLIYTSFEPKQVLSLVTLSPYGIFSGQNGNILTTLMRKPQLLQAINDLLEETVLDNLPRPVQDDEGDVVVEDAAAPDNLLLLDSKEAASAKQEERLEASRDQRREVSEALAKGNLDATMLLPKPRREPRRNLTTFAEAASTIQAGSNQLPSAPGLIASTPAETGSGPSLPPLSVSAVQEALATPTARTMPRRRDLKEQLLKANAGNSQLSAVEIAQLANNLKNNPEAIEVLLALAQEEKVVIEESKQHGIVQSLATQSGDDTGKLTDELDEDNHEAFHTPNSSKTTSKSVSFGQDGSGVAQSGIPAKEEAAAPRLSDDHEIKLLTKDSETFVYKYRKPVKNFPVPTLKYTKADADGKRKYFYEDFQTKERVFWDNNEVLFSLVNHHLELPPNLNVDEEVKLASGVFTIKQLIEDGFNILQKDNTFKNQVANKWNWREKEGDSDVDDEVSKITSERPPPPYDDEPVYQDLEPKMDENNSTLLLGDKDATMVDAGGDETTKLPPGFMNTGSSFSAFDQTGSRTSAGVQSPRLNVAAGRGRGRGGPSGS